MIQLTEDEKRLIYLLDGMAAGIEAAKQCALREIVKKAANTPPEPPKE